MFLEKFELSLLPVTCSHVILNVKPAETSLCVRAAYERLLCQTSCFSFHERDTDVRHCRAVSARKFQVICTVHHVTSKTRNVPLPWMFLLLKSNKAENKPSIRKDCCLLTQKHGSPHWSVLKLKRETAHVGNENEPKFKGYV